MYSVLIIEDNIMHLEIEQELLKNAGFDVLKTNNAINGIKIAEKQKPDIILMDMNLPDLDGYSATKMLKTNSQTQDIPIIATTALVMKNDVLKALNSGCSGLIPKPLDVSAFVQTVKNYVEYKKKLKNIEEVYDEIDKKNHPKQPKLNENNKIQDESTHKILIVDDNPMNAELLKEAVEQMNKITFVAHSGKKALEFAKQTTFDLILLDIMMPEISGFELIKNFKKQTRNIETPVIFISALNETKDIVKGLDLGSYDYITKPYNIDEFKARISSVLRIKDLQDKLKQEKEKFDQINKFSADGIIILNSKFEIVSGSERIIEWFGIKKIEFLNKNIFLLLKSLNDKILLSDFNHENVAKHNTLMELEIKKDEQTKFIEVNSSPITNLQNKIEGYVLILRNVTAQREIEKQKETFIATLTHDLKTPIRAEMRSLELLLKGNFGHLNEGQNEIIQEILLSSKFMSNMVDTLLAGYQYDNGKVELHKEIVDINELIKTCCSELKYLIQEKKQELILEFQTEHQSVNLDTIEIRRLITNLLSNAANYTQEKGLIKITSKVEDNYIKISFIDNGRGISSEQLSNLFDKYRSYSKKFRQVGTGLGLYVSKQIVNAHGGFLNVESEEGKGSTFTFCLPLIIQ